MGEGIEGTSLDNHLRRQFSNLTAISASSVLCKYADDTIMSSVNRQYGQDELANAEA